MATHKAWCYVTKNKFINNSYIFCCISITCSVRNETYYNIIISHTIDFIYYLKSSWNVSCSLGQSELLGFPYFL